MPLLDRFTRDEVSAKIWWPLALLLVVAFVLTFPGRGRAIGDVQADATDWSASVTGDSIAPLLAADDVSDGSIDEASSLTAALDGASAGGTLRAIRIWGSDGTLLFSTLSTDELGSQEAFNDEQVQAALEGPVTLTVRESSGGEDIAPQFHVYLAIPDAPGAVAQFEFPESRLLEDVRSTWFVYQLIAGIAAIVALVFAALSTREPIARIGAKVPFYPTSIPKGSAVMDIDEATALKQAGYHARQRVAAMEGRLHELEEENRKLGGDLQRALTALSTTQRPGIPTAIPRPAAPAPAAPPAVSIGTDAAAVPTMKVRRGEKAAPAEPAAASVAPVEELAPSGSGDAVQIARPPREAKPARTRRPAPNLEPVSQPEPELEPVSEPEVAISEPEPVLNPEPVTEPEPAVVVLPEPEPEVAPEPEPSAEPVPTVAASDDDRGPVYEETWASSVREPESVDDVLARITVPEAAPVSAEEASILRAKLARTAALKKPGSRERREASENGKH